MKYFRNRRQLDLEGELRASRPEPRADFVKMLANEVRSRPPEPSRAGRLGLALALSGLILVALASFGGISYAFSAAPHAVKKQAVPEHVWIVEKPNTAATAQYGKCPPECTATTTTTTPSTTPSTSSSAAPNTFTPPAAKPTKKSTKKPTKTTTFKPPKTKPNAPAGGPAGEAGTVKVKGSQLPFTGLALWVPLAIGLLLLGTGIGLRTRGRRGNSGAH